MFAKADPTIVDLRAAQRLVDLKAPIAVWPVTFSACRVQSLLEAPRTRRLQFAVKFIVKNFFVLLQFPLHPGSWRKQWVSLMQRCMVPDHLRFSL